MRIEGLSVNTRVIVPLLSSITTMSFRQYSAADY